MVRRNLAKLAFGVLFLASCHKGPEPFAITGTYDAPKSGLRVIAYAKGVEGTAAPVTAIACPTTKAGHPLRIDAPTTATKLTRALSDAAYPMPDPTELAEIPDTIDAVGLGPKSVRIAGQTHQLTVVSVDFQARAQPTTASCPP